MNSKHKARITDFNNYVYSHAECKEFINNKHSAKHNVQYVHCTRTVYLDFLCCTWCNLTACSYSYWAVLHSTFRDPSINHFYGKSFALMSPWCRTTRKLILRSVAPDAEPFEGWPLGQQHLMQNHLKADRQILGIWYKKLSSWSSSHWHLMKNHLTADPHVIGIWCRTTWRLVLMSLASVTTGSLVMGIWCRSTWRLTLMSGAPDAEPHVADPQARSTWCWNTWSWFLGQEHLMQNHLKADP
jgi:hypothetical protein